MNKFYVYVHRRASDNKIFYVGKGTRNRAWSSNGRNKYWKNVVNKHGKLVEIVLEELEEDCAFELERELISFYGVENLTNLSTGGEGSSGFSYSQEMKDRLSQSKRLAYSLMSPEERAARLAWQNDKEKKQIATSKMLNWWNSKSDADKKAHAEVARANMYKRLEKLTPDERKEQASRLAEYANKRAPDKMVVNGKILFDSKKNLLTAISSDYASLYRASIAGCKRGFDFFVLKGYFIEVFDPSKHPNLVKYSGDKIPCLNFRHLPINSAFKTNKNEVFLSSVEAAEFCGLSSRDFSLVPYIKSSNLFRDRIWQYAENEDIKEEIFFRLSEITNPTT